MQFLHKNIMLSEVIKSLSAHMAEHLTCKQELWVCHALGALFCPGLLIGVVCEHKLEFVTTDSPEHHCKRMFNSLCMDHCTGTIIIDVSYRPLNTTSYNKIIQGLCL